MYHERHEWVESVTERFLFVVCCFFVRLVAFFNGDAPKLTRVLVDFVVR